MIIWWTSENNLIIIIISSALYRWCADDLLMIFQGSWLITVLLSYDDHVIIMWLLCDYHVIIIWWSSNDHQIIILWSAEEDLRRIWLSAVDFHMLMWWSCDYCVIIIKWSSNVHLMIISLGDVKMLGCVSTHYSVGTFIAVYLGDVKLVWFRFLGRCQDSLVLVPREALGCVPTHV